MKHNETDPRYQKLLRCFTHLPQQILSLSGTENMTEYVLHSLCEEGCLNISKAAYFIDNPDFDCLKGVAGYNKDEETYTCDTVMGADFKEHMDKCAFNKKVREMSFPSPRRVGEEHERHVDRLANLLGIQSPVFHTWNIKHDNYGLLIYEIEKLDDSNKNEFLEGLSILGFCPVS